MRKGDEEAEASFQADGGHAKGGVGVTGIAMELSGGHGPGLDSFLRIRAGYK